ncbi:MAG: redoxin domain-containing protein [Proteobacteria bacterium]|nr:redoxin domain-containing protein [Pseudomonadota bacterium]
MKKPYFILTGLFVLAVVSGYLFSSGRMTINLDEYAPPMPGGDFTLQSHKGQVKLSDFKGKVVLIYFGYTYCPDVCPTALALTTAALKELNESELAQTQTLFISVDPERDTPDRLVEYAHFFHPNILGITGTKPEIDDITKRFGAYYRIPDHVSGGNYAVDHSSQTLVIGKDGEIKATIAHGTLPEPMLLTIREHY